MAQLCEPWATSEEAPMTERAPTRAVYTALIGGYERLQEQPVAKTTDIPFICFTDDPGVTSTTWDVRVVEPALLADPSRSSRYPKILGEPLAGEYDETLWIDNRVVLHEEPGALLDDLLGDADVAVMHHSFRPSVIAEFDEVVRGGLDEPARVYEQLIHYAETRPGVLDERPYWGGFIARRWTPEVRAAMRTWMDHVLRYSRRDQLSFRYALDGLARVKALDLDNFGSDWHTWHTDPVEAGRNQAMRQNAYKASIRAPLAVVAGLERDLAGLRERLEAETRRADDATDRAAELRARVRKLRGKVSRLSDKVAAERARTTRLRAELAEVQARPGVVRRVLGRIGGR
jgi:hypothetical protein